MYNSIKIFSQHQLADFHTTILFILAFNCLIYLKRNKNDTKIVGIVLTQIIIFNYFSIVNWHFNP